MHIWRMPRRSPRSSLALHLRCNRGHQIRASSSACKSLPWVPARWNGSGLLRTKRPCVATCRRGLRHANSKNFPRLRVRGCGIISCQRELPKPLGELALRVPSAGISLTYFQSHHNANITDRRAAHVEVCEPPLSQWQFDPTFNVWNPHIAGNPAWLRAASSCVVLDQRGAGGRRCRAASNAGRSGAPYSLGSHQRRAAFAVAYANGDRAGKLARDAGRRSTGNLVNLPSASWRPAIPAATPRLSLWMAEWFSRPVAHSVRHCRRCARNPACPRAGRVPCPGCEDRKDSQRKLFRTWGLAVRDANVERHSTAS